MSPLMDIFEIPINIQVNKIYEFSKKGVNCESCKIGGLKESNKEGFEGK